MVPYVIRLGDGVKANDIHTDSGGNFSFQAFFPGTRYNGTTITVSGGDTIVVVPAPGTGRRDSQAISSDKDLRDWLRDEVARGHQSFSMIGPISLISVTIPNGTYVLSGGTNGALTSELFKTHIIDTELTGVDIICPIGLTTTDVTGNVVDEIDCDPYPSLLVVQSPTLGIGATGILNDRKNIVSVAFDLIYDQGDTFQRTDDASPYVAGLISTRRFDITLAQLLNVVPNTTYDQVGLHAVTDAGHVVAYRSISKGWALWYGVTGDSNWPISTFRAYQELVGEIYAVLEPIIGRVLTDLSELRSNLDERFQGLTASTVQKFTLDLQRDTLFCTVWFIPYGEVRIIKARIALARQEFPVN